VNVGGYRGYEYEFKNDTNKEDLDIMHRLIKYMYDNLLAYKISYSCFGNYYRVMPDSILGLRKLRRRWQREYIDVLITHSEMLFNPNYGLTGEVNSVINLILEFLGPCFELIALVVFSISCMSGILSFDIILFVFLGVMIGTMPSVFPICMLNSDSEKSSISEILMFSILSVISTFGYLHIVRLLKISDAIGAMKKYDGYYQKRFVFKSNESENRKAAKRREKERSQDRAIRRARMQIRTSLKEINTKN
jgi:hypothetical protein